jgi:hypothetical protein
MVWSCCRAEALIFDLGRTAVRPSQQRVTPGVVIASEKALLDADGLFGVDLYWG